MNDFDFKKKVAENIDLNLKTIYPLMLLTSILSLKAWAFAGCIQQQIIMKEEYGNPYTHSFILGS